MAAADEPLLITVQQYRELPSREDIIQELHWGQVVTLTRPKMRQTNKRAPNSPILYFNYSAVWIAKILP